MLPGGAAPPAPACCRCAHQRRASPLTCLAVCFLVLSYNLLGGFLFLALEGTAPEETAVAASQPDLARPAEELRERTVERLWSITEDLNILYKENWTMLAARELLDFQRALVASLRAEPAPPPARLPPARPLRPRWSFSASFLYALTLITTIGHGNVTPRSPVGKLVAVAYACVGIPIIMLYLSTIGEALARRVRALYSRVLPRPRAARPARPDPPRRTPFQAALNLDTLSAPTHFTCRDHTRVPILLSLLLIALYIALGTVVFHSTERWTWVDGCYFSFASLATIGFGELRPGLHASTVSAKAEDVAVGVCCLYILVGVVVVAMCFNLVQEELGGLARGAGLCAGAGRCAGRAVHAQPAADDKLPVSVLS
ncbi:potassium channel subfamily K member 15-like [Helicoverpa zea]|uniref:potassium channel subfamily K member 15-like n=1 Tax=Helicoverpa zea TaxID=7113 RepID=UPI001F58B85F|nr:potassium channel subfamily K member 15-like [Helicoverpa zea]